MLLFCAALFLNTFTYKGKKLKKDISDTLRIGSLISTLLIIAIHYNSIANLREYKSYTLNFYIQEFISGGLSRIAVPYFAILSGYFSQLKKKEMNAFKNLLIKKSRTLLLPYFIASYFIFLSSSIIALLLKEPNALDLYRILACLRGIFVYPSVHLWYLRDLLVLTVSAPLLIYLPKRFQYLFCLLLGVLWMVEIQPLPVIKGWYLINNETLFFFVLGGVFNGSDLHKLRKFLNLKSFVLFLSFWVLLIIVRIINKPDFFIWYSSNYTIISLILYKISILCGILVLVIGSYHMRSNRKLLFLSGFNFFVYLYHLFPLFYFRRITVKLIPVEYSFYLDYLIAVCVSFYFAWLFYKFFPGFNKIIVGDRTPEKIRVDVKSF